MNCYLRFGGLNKLVMLDFFFENSIQLKDAFRETIFRDYSVRFFLNRHLLIDMSDKILNICGENGLAETM